MSERVLSSTPAGSHLRQKRSDKPIVFELPSAKQHAAGVTEWQINTVKHPAAKDIFFLKKLKRGAKESETCQNKTP